MQEAAKEEMRIDLGLQAVSGGAGLVELGHLEGWDLGLPGAASSSV